MDLESRQMSLCFKHLGVSKLSPPEPILSNVSGYIKSSGITAVLGASASGKSLLMQALAGHLYNLKITGDIFLEGMRIDPKLVLSSKIGYVSQETILLGELTARETFTISALLKRNKDIAKINSDVSKLLDALGLATVADVPIGTVFVRGISGGQKKRVEIGSELIAAPSILMIDEPTSGLDASIALEVLNSIKNILNSGGSKLSVMLSIHQPNSRILELFDHIMLLGGGGMLFFGTARQCVDHFSAIGFAPPKQYTPTDYFLQISDTNFGPELEFDFEGSFGCSDQCARLMATLNHTRRKSVPNYNFKQTLSTQLSDMELADPAADGGNLSSVEQGMRKASFWRQYWTLLRREFLLALRDPSLYYLQFVLMNIFGVLVGGAFFQLKYEIDADMKAVTGAMAWMTVMMCYLQVFKIYHLHRASHRFKHEKANNTYEVLPYFLAESTATCIFLLLYIPGLAICYFMMGFPGRVFPFTMLCMWLTALTAESLLNLFTKFHHDVTVCIVASQCTLVMLTIFNAGLYRPWNDVPDYWFWLQEIALITQGSRALVANVLNAIDFGCTLTNGVCVGPQSEIYPCDATPSDGARCSVKGRTVLLVTQGSTTMHDLHWVALGWLALIFLCIRLAILFLYYCPLERIVFSITQWWHRGLADRLLMALIRIRRMDSQLVAFISESHKEKARKTAMMIRQASTIGVDSRPALEELFEEDQAELPSEFLDESVAEDELCLLWEGLTLTLKKNGNKLLDNVSGMARSGRVLALMGPSGAGKTTMLNALGNRASYANISGKMTFGKRPFTPSDLYYVPQFDEFNDILTVFEQIELVGLLKCRDRTDLYHRLHLLMDILGLQSKGGVLCRDLTGGELKRVSVGMGMISSPNVLFLDEPTTGLDSSAAFSIVQHIVDMALTTNVTVILTIHQPAAMVFDMLQDLYLLEGGRMAYFGPVAAASRYFASLGHHCPSDSSLADFCLDLVYRPTNDGESQWRELYASSAFAKNMRLLETAIFDASAVTGDPPEPPSEIDRLQELLSYFWKYYTREKGFYILRIVFMVVIALFIGTIFLRLQAVTGNLLSYSGAVFFNSWTVFFTVIACTGLMARDRRLSVEQAKNHVISPATYCLAQFLTSLPFNLLAAIVFQSITHWLCNLNPEPEPFFYAVLITWGHLLLMEAMMLCVVQVLRNAMLSTTSSIIVVGGLFLYSGFFRKPTQMPAWIGWICYIMPTKYSFDGYINQMFGSQRFQIPHSPFYLTGGQVLSQLFSQNGTEAWPMFLVLLAFVVLFRLVHLGLFIVDVFLYIY